MSSQSNQLIIEDGYNTSYMISLIVALFFPNSREIVRILSTDTSNSNAYYIQAFIRSCLIDRMRRGVSIDSATLNRLRIFMYDAGWLRDSSREISDPADIVDFYKYLVTQTMEYRLTVQRLNPTTNESDEQSFDIICLTDEHFDDSPIVNLSDGFKTWIERSIVDSKYEYRFDTTSAPVPWLIPIHINLRDPTTRLNRRLVDCMEGLQFHHISDKIHSMFVWDIQSFVCCTKTGEYYAVTNQAGQWMMTTDRTIPSVSVVDMSDRETVRRLMSEIQVVFYKLQTM